MNGIEYVVRPALDNAQLDALFAAGSGSAKPGYQAVLARSFTWVGAYANDRLVGFVNVAWDGGAHFFLLDTTVHPDARGRGVGRGLVDAAIDACRGHGHWLHVDANAELMQHLYEPAGFEATAAGLVDLRD